MRFISLLGILFITSVGCAETPERPERDGDRRGAIGKADVPGTCSEANVCGGQSSGGCWCDEACVDYGDCCSDVEAECGVDVPDDDPADPCAPQDAQGVGLCEAFWGYAWNGTECVGLSGCSCEGDDCDDTWLDLQDCQDAHNLCGDTVEFCGGFAGITCPDGEYCAYDPSHCGQSDQAGTCATKPDFCTQQYDPVCGCNGQTYGNACMAANAGVSVEHDGECGQLPAGDSCVDQCGGQSADGSCWCDDLCSYYGDCCDDAQSACNL